MPGKKKNLRMVADSDAESNNADSDVEDAEGHDEPMDAADLTCECCGKSPKGTDTPWKNQNVLHKF